MNDSTNAFWTGLRGDVVPVVIVGPLQDGVRGQLGAVVAHDRLELVAFSEEPIKLASDPDAEDRGVGHQRQASAREGGCATGALTENQRRPRRLTM